MAFEAYNADGEPIEGVLPPEEIKTLQQQLVETNEKLSKLENKDFNFRKLEQMTEEEKSKLSATELLLKKQQEELEEKQNSFITNTVSEIKNDVLESLAGDDADLKAKIELNFNRLKDSDNAKTRKEIKDLMSEAYSMSIGSRPHNPVFSAHNAGGNPVIKTEKTSSDFVDFAKKFGVSEEELKNV